MPGQSCAGCLGKHCTACGAGQTRRTGPAYRYQHKACGASGPLKLAGKVLIPPTEVSWWTRASTSSSMCSGAFTAEMALAVASAVVNASQVLPRHVHIQPVAAWDPCLQRFCDWLLRLDWTQTLGPLSIRSLKLIRTHDCNGLT